MNEFAVSSGDIGAAMQTAGSALAASNNSLAESVGLWTAMNEILQNGDIAATSIRFISQRMRNTSGQLEEMGLDADGAVESITKLQQEVYKLSGVNIMKDSNTFRGNFEVLEELSEKWDTLTDKDQADLTRLLAGTRQASAFSALMTNFDQAKAVVAAAEDSMGSAMTEHERWTQSIEYSEQRAAAAFQEFAITVMSSDLIKGVYDTGAGILGFLTNVIEKLGAIPALAATVAGALSFKNIGISKMNMPYPTCHGAVA